MFFRSFSMPRAFDTPNAQHRQNTGRSDTKRTSELPRFARKCSKIDPGALPIAFGDANGARERLGSGPRASWSVSGAPRGSFWSAPGLLGASPDRPWGSIWASKRRPERIRTHPRNGLSRPNRPTWPTPRNLASHSAVPGPSRRRVHKTKSELGQL